VTWWQTAVVSISASLVGGCLALAGSAFMFRAQERARRRRETGAAVGAALAALRDVEPEESIARLVRHEHGRQLIDERGERWRAASAGLDVLAATHARGRVPALCDSVIKTGHLVVVRLEEAVRGGYEYPDEKWWKALNESHALAMAELRDLVRLTHDDPA
jgi:hypothetical protein